MWAVWPASCQAAKREGRTWTRRDTLSLTTAFILLTGIRPLFGDTEFSAV